MATFRHVSRSTVLLFIALTLSSTSALRADDPHELIKDAHQQLAQAMNVGGAPPSDSERMVDLKAADKDLKDMALRGRFSRSRGLARRHIQAALDLISRGDPDHGAAEEIRTADSLVRDIEG